MPVPVSISASRGAAVLGLSEYRSQFDVWLDIMESREPGFAERNGYDYEPFEGNASTRWGSAFEDAIVELAEGVQGAKIIDREALHMLANETPYRAYFPENKEIDINNLDENVFMTCHIDGQYTGKSTLHEAKTTNAYTFRDKWGDPGTDRIPMDYMIQCQHQMACTGADEVIVSVLVFPKRPDEWEAEGWEIKPGVNIGDTIGAGSLINREFGVIADPTEWASVFAQIGNFHQYRVPRNQILIDEMIKHYTHFWNNHVLTGKPPEPKKYDDIRKLLTSPVGEVVLDEDLQRLSAAYKMCTHEISELNKLKDHYKTQILKSVIKNKKVVDDGGQDKLIMLDGRGNKLNSYGREKKGMVFR